MKRLTRELKATLLLLTLAGFWISTTNLAAREERLDKANERTFEESLPYYININ